MGTATMRKHTLQNKIRLFQQYLTELIPYAALPDDVLLNPQSKEKLYTTERLFQLLVDEATDINSLLLQLKGKRFPETYVGTFSELPAVGILERSFADKLSGSVRILNHIVHEYEDIKPSEVMHHIKRYTEMYKDYIKAIVASVF